MYIQVTHPWNELFRFKALIAPCKVIRIPESMKFLLMESGILGIGIQNPAKEWIQNSFVENPFRIVLTAFTRINATTVMLKRRPQTADRADHADHAYFAGEFRPLKSHKICLQHQHGDGPHVSNYDKLWIKVYGYLWKPDEVYFWVEVSAFERKPLSLIFGIQKNKI